MREFYLLYRDLPKVQLPVAQIGWTHNLSGRIDYGIQAGPETLG